MNDTVSDTQSWSLLLAGQLFDRSTSKIASVNEHPRICILARGYPVHEPVVPAPEQPVTEAGACQLATSFCLLGG